MENLSVRRRFFVSETIGVNCTCCFNYTFMNRLINPQGPSPAHRTNSKLWIYQLIPRHLNTIDHSDPNITTSNRSQSKKLTKINWKGQMVKGVFQICRCETQLFMRLDFNSSKCITGCQTDPKRPGKPTIAMSAVNHHSTKNSSTFAVGGWRVLTSLHSCNLLINELNVLGCLSSGSL